MFRSRICVCFKSGDITGSGSVIADVMLLYKFHTASTMARTIAFIALTLSLLMGCAERDRSAKTVAFQPQSQELVDGQQIELVGTAVILASHADKTMRRGISTSRGEFLFYGEYETIPEDPIGCRVRVTGTIRQKRLPMFEHPNDGSPAPQGIPVPAGTDIEKLSVYFVIESPIWKLLK